MIRRNFWQSFLKNLYIGFRATLEFWQAPGLENLRWLELEHNAQLVNKPFQSATRLFPSKHVRVNFQDKNQQR